LESENGESGANRTMPTLAASPRARGRLPRHQPSPPFAVNMGAKTTRSPTCSGNAVMREVEAEAEVKMEVDVGVEVTHALPISGGLIAATSKGSAGK
jgi:hypothetical protein